MAKRKTILWIESFSQETLFRFHHGTAVNVMVVLDMGNSHSVLWGILSNILICITINNIRIMVSKGIIFHVFIQ